MSEPFVSPKCPNCHARVSEPGTCPFCGAPLVRQSAFSAGDGGEDDGAPSLASAGPPPGAEDLSPPWVAEARQLVAEGRKIAAIRLVRWHTGFRLKESKELVERHLDDPAKTAGLPTNPQPLEEISVSASSCFPGEARVATPSGPVPMGRLREDDAVWSWCERTKGQVVARVRKVKVHLPARLWAISVRTRPEPIVATGNHRLLTHRGWIRVDALAPGDTLVSPSAAAGDPVLSAQPTDEVKTVYNLITDGPHTYLVDGLIAHNFSCLRRTRTVLHRLLGGRFRVGAPLPEAGGVG